MEKNITKRKKLKVIFSPSCCWKRMKTFKVLSMHTDVWESLGEILSDLMDDMQVNFGFAIFNWQM